MEDNIKIQKRVDDFLITDKEIGRGSFGGVFLGYSVKDSNLQVAVKVLRLLDRDQDEVNRFFSEIKILKSLNHPNLVKLLHTCDTKDNLYMVFDYCKDGNLATYCETIKKNKQFAIERPALTEIQAINFFKQIVAGYFNLYQHNIIHRDLKPQNIFIHAGCLKIGDFGLARKFSIKDKIVADTKCGTPLYMAPEINVKNEYDNYCDMWSLGIIFYELLYGKTPWTGFSEYNLYQNIQTLPLAFPASISRNEQAKNIIRMTLEKDPAKRMKWGDFFTSIEKLEEANEPVLIKGNLIHKNIKIIDHERDPMEEFKALSLHDVVQGISVISEDWDEILGFSRNKRYELIQNAKDYIFYQRNVAALLKKASGLLMEIHRKHMLSISADLFFRALYMLQSASHLMLSDLMTAINAKFIACDELCKEFFESVDYSSVKQELKEDFTASEFEMKAAEEMVNEKVNAWMKNDNEIVNNIEFISWVRSEKKEISGEFKSFFEDSIRRVLNEQYELLKEGLIEDKDLFRLLRYLQIVSSIDGIYKILNRVKGEDNSYLFFSLFDLIDNSTIEELKSLVQAAMKKV